MRYYRNYGAKNINLAPIDDLVKVLPTHEQTGKIVTFDSPFAGLPLKKCIVDIPVTQEGTGDPSPYNVRNFVGIDSLDFSATGKNLLRMNRSTATVDGVTFTVNEDFSITTSGEYQGRTAIFITSFLVILRAGTYTFTGCPSGGSYSDYVLRIEDSSNARIALDTGNGATFTLTEDQPVYCRIYIYSQNGVGKTFYPMVRLVDSNSNYEPFGYNKLFTFGQTIYAGVLDVLTGIFTATYVGKLIRNTGTWTKSGSNIYRFFPDLWTAITPDTPTGRKPLFCSHFAYTSGSATDLTIQYGGTNNNGNIIIRDDAFETISDFNDYVANNDVFIVYPLATPEVINLGGMDISTLKGRNNLFSSVGDTTAEYYTL